METIIITTEADIEKIIERVIERKFPKPIKYIKIEKDIVWLIPANDKYQPIKVTQENDFLIWGIVTYSIKKQR